MPANHIMSLAFFLEHSSSFDSRPASDWFAGVCVCLCAICFLNGRPFHVGSSLIWPSIRNDSLEDTSNTREILLGLVLCETVPEEQTMPMRMTFD